MNILIACEESQRVCTEFRKLGHNAFSCDIEDCSGGHPEWHIKGDVLKILEPKEIEVFGRKVKGIVIEPCQGEWCFVEKWDMIIAFPPCTYLTSAGTKHYSLRCNPPEKVEARIKEREKAVEFFLTFANADCEHIAIENPVGYMNTHWKKPSQIIHPYYFAESTEDTENYVQKRTCLWLKGLPTLTRKTELKKPEPLYYCQGEKRKGKAIGWCEGIRNTTGGQKGRAKARSKTFPAIAKAMAEQWGNI